MVLYPEMIKKALATVIYPGTKKNIVESEMLADNMRIDGMKVSFSLIFPRETDPFLKSVVKAAEHFLFIKRNRALSITMCQETWR